MSRGRAGVVMKADGGREDEEVTDKENGRGAEGWEMWCSRRRVGARRVGIGRLMGLECLPFIPLRSGVRLRNWVGLDWMTEEASGRKEKGGDWMIEDSGRLFLERSAV